MDSDTPAEEEIQDISVNDPGVLSLKNAMSNYKNFDNLTFSLTDGIPTMLVGSGDVNHICSFIKNDPTIDGQMLLCMAGVDYEDYAQIVYIIYSLNNNETLVIKSNLNYDQSIDSVANIWAAANWYEREIHDLYGILFDGNEDMSPLLLYEGFEGYPGRKDYPFYEYDEF
ncbi:MAG TPA: NADH-quinone oxidoreductase subunit C [Dehalococcoidia bacterium]|jgi:NADH-quinone oxidoreductase subunit C|nr:NADH-quinone oxidoreductase subunit C [Dehalococcoidia bacterium]|tara:strand:- start:200 stop:709 length:510 start_codon:yes stop_codon:yes gene_type:complete